ncbi:TetR/AcrR family transcriptional regulator [Mycetocola saprophilus]|uniref:TetR/AcrR family transcriptional regulator n=1 Tax=Mycetocola saprophilus TaxID=76636 RepID=UPI003BF2BE2E
MAATVGLTREHVGIVAAELADRLGFSRVTVSALARELGVKPASLYAHVRGLDELREVVATRAHTVLADALTQAANPVTGRAALAATAEVMRKFTEQHPGLWEASRVPFSGEAYVSAARRASAALAQIARGYGLPETEIPHAVRILGSSIGGFIGVENAGGFAQSQPETAHSLNRLIDILDRSLLDWPIPISEETR